MEYITDVLGVRVIRKPWADSNKLSYFLTDEYTFEYVILDDFECVFVKPKENMAVINTVKKHLNAIKKASGLPIVFEFANLSRQKRKSLIENKIPFVVAYKQLYLPFMGAVLQEKFDRETEMRQGFETLLPSAQLILFSFIYGKCKPLYLSEIARKINITPMSASRAANQLVSLKLLQVKMRGRSKILHCETDGKELFQNARQYLICPVRKTVYIDKKQINNEMFKSGLTAVSDMTMLNQPQTETYGTVESIRNFRCSLTPIDTEKQCMLEFWKYDATLLSGTKRADVLSLALCLEKENDERMQMEIEQLLAEIWE